VTTEDLLAAAQVKDDLDRLRRELSQALSSQVANHTISLEMGPMAWSSACARPDFFDSGSALPKLEALPTLRDIAAKLGAAPFDLRIEGHTDNVPDPQRPVRLQLGTLPRPGHAHRAALSRHECHTPRPPVGRRLCRISSRRQQCHRLKAARKIAASIWW
jgi:hypothetical protein